MDDGEYERSIKATPERIIASLLVATWIVSAYLIFGLPLAIRTFVFYLFPLAFIWVPEFMVRLPSMSRRYPTPSEPVLPNALRLAGWLVILGIPVVWAAFYWTMKAN